MASPRILTLDEAAEFRPQQVVELSHNMVAVTQQRDALKLQLDWFKRQIFGQKSEKRFADQGGQQLSLGELVGVGTPPATQGKVIAAHTRHAPSKTTAESSSDFFDETRVPIETIAVNAPEQAGLTAEAFAAAYEVIGEKVSHRLAQRPGSYVVLKYVRPVLKSRLASSAGETVITCPPAPVGVIEGSRADVSFIAGLLLDKFLYHLPLYRQHLRLQDAGFKLSRPWLTQLTQQAIALLEPIYEAQLASIRQSRVKSMDETPIKAGQSGNGKMKSGYFWPVYGELGEIVFPFCPSRAAHHIERILGGAPPIPPPDHASTGPSVLLTDGYAAYESYAKNSGLLHAQCWAHSRRKFFEAQSIEPEKAAQALDQIGALYAVEAHIRENNLTDEAKRVYRQQHAAPLAAAFFVWVQRQFDEQGFLPSSPLTKALAYVRERQAGLSIFLDDPDVPIDTNHLERALRVIPMGRKNWLFCWTEVGAKHAGIIQSLLVTCRVQKIDPYDYLVDVLQRVGQHPATEVAQLTPRRWKQHFAEKPLRSDLYCIGAGKESTPIS